VPRTSSVRLPLRYRRHALARLDTVIAAAERDRAGHLAAVRRVAAAGKNATRARAKLRLADYRLGLLRRTRAWLAAGELPHAGDT
jgi:hypothetical protein